MYGYSVCGQIYIICDALQQNKEQVAQAYFEIYTIEFGTGVKNNSSVDFEIFFFLHTLICFLSPPCDFWPIFKYFPTKILHFLQPGISKTIGIGNFRGRYLKISLPEKPLTILYTNGHISKSRSMNLILESN